MRKYLYHSIFRILLFALSISDVSREARYIRVVPSESCPMPPLMTGRGIPALPAMLAHECRAV